MTEALFVVVVMYDLLHTMTVMYNLMGIGNGSLCLSIVDWMMARVVCSCKAVKSVC